MPQDPGTGETLGNGDRTPEGRQTLRNFMAVVEPECRTAFHRVDRVWREGPIDPAPNPSHAVYDSP
ncbi:MAG: hypothetical protein ACK5QW_05630 [Cyanobacteriota bacterium]